MIRPESAPAGAKPALAAWSSNLSVYLCTAGAAVGLGSIWRFPYLAGTGGGSAFILVFVLACVLVATPLLAAEFALGRASRLSPPDAAGAVAQAAVACVWLLRYVCPIAILAVFIATLV
jgi:NSS family neurotransmitter:Na+ symporter